MVLNKIGCKLEKKILSTMRTVNIELDLQQEATGINMSYNFITNKIGYDPERIFKAKEELHKPISLETYIQIFTLHELGHALDRDSLLSSLEKELGIFEIKKKYSIKEQYNDSKLLAVLVEYHEMNIQFEKTAWENAEKLNRQFNIVDQNVFNQMQAHSLETYTNLFENDFNIYNQLLLNEGREIA